MEGLPAHGGGTDRVDPVGSVEDPPRHGEGDREAVEGSHLSVNAAEEAKWDPTVSPADCHLPVPGRIFYRTS